MMWEWLLLLPLYDDIHIPENRYFVPICQVEQPIEELKQEYFTAPKDIQYFS